MPTFPTHQPHVVLLEADIKLKAISHDHGLDFNLILHRILQRYDCFLTELEVEGANRSRTLRPSINALQRAFRNPCSAAPDWGSETEGRQVPASALLGIFSDQLEKEGMKPDPFCCFAVDRARARMFAPSPIPRPP